MGTIIIALVGFTMVFAQSVRQALATPTLRKRGSLSTMRPPLLELGSRYHYFISHVWATGQE